MHVTRFSDLRYKEVVNVCDGTRYGYVCDAEIDITCGEILSLIVPGCIRFPWIFGAQEEFIIPWDAIKKIGDDIILVEKHHHYHR